MGRVYKLGQRRSGDRDRGEIKERGAPAGAPHTPKQPVPRFTAARPRRRQPSRRQPPAADGAYWQVTVMVKVSAMMQAPLIWPSATMTDRKPPLANVARLGNVVSSMVIVSVEDGPVEAKA